MPKYTEIKIYDGEVNVSSSSHYTYKGSCRESGHWLSFDTDGYYFFRRDHRSSEDWRDWEPPAYMVAQVRQQIGQLTREDKFKYFEYNQDRVKRFDGLRYHYQEYVDHIKADW
jgi:hypothetical protein